LGYFFYFNLNLVICFESMSQSACVIHANLYFKYLSLPQTRWLRAIRCQQLNICFFHSSPSQIFCTISCWLYVNKKMLIESLKIINLTAQYNFTAFQVIDRCNGQLLYKRLFWDSIYIAKWKSQTLYLLKIWPIFGPWKILYTISCLFFADYNANHSKTK